MYLAVLLLAWVCWLMCDWLLISVRCCCAYNGAEAEVCAPYMQLCMYSLQELCHCISNCMLFLFFLPRYLSFCLPSCLLFCLPSCLLFCLPFVYHLVYHFVCMCVGYPSAHQWSWCNGVHTSCSDETHAETDSRPKQPASPCEHVCVNTMRFCFVCQIWKAQSELYITKSAQERVARVRTCNSNRSP